MAAEFAETIGRTAERPKPDDDQAWREIDLLASELAELAKSAVTVDEFYDALLARLQAALPLAGGAVWQVVPDAPVVRIAQMGTPPLADATLLSADALRAAAKSSGGSSIIVPPHATLGRATVANPSSRPLVLCPVPADDATLFLIAIALDESSPPAAQQAAAQLLDLFAESAQELHQRRELQTRRQQDRQLREFDQLVTRLHASLNLEQTAATIVNDGRLWIGCDRVSVALLRGGRVRVWAVSGSEHVDRRAQQVQRLEALLAAVHASDEPLLWPAEVGKELPPQIDVPLQAYLDHSHARQLLATPLWRSMTNTQEGTDREPVGVLIAESFDAGQSGPRLRQGVDEVARHGGAALALALQHHDLPLRPFQETAGRALAVVKRRPVAALLAAGCCAAIVAALVFVPADFSVSASGTLVPQTRRHLFAPANGVIERVAANHGQNVEAGDELLQLRDPQLEVDYGRLSGELQTAEARLAAVRARRSTRSTATSPQEEDRQLAAEEEQLKEQRAGLTAQLEVLKRHRAELRIASPLTGVVLTWNPAELLQDRPVRAGQRLLTVADSSGAWVLELPVPDADIGHILAAQQRQRAELPVTFLLATEPAVTHRGHVAAIATNSEGADGQPPAVLVTVQLDEETPAAVRAGASVIARIHCGRRSVAYVWLHDLIDAVRTQLLF